MCDKVECMLRKLELGEYSPLFAAGNHAEGEDEEAGKTVNLNDGRFSR